MTTVALLAQFPAMHVVMAVGAQIPGTGELQRRVASRASDHGVLALQGEPCGGMGELQRRQEDRPGFRAVALFAGDGQGPMG